MHSTKSGEASASEADGVAVVVTPSRLAALDAAAKNIRASILLLEETGADQDAADRAALVLEVIEARRDMLRAEQSS